MNETRNPSTPAGDGAAGGDTQRLVKITLDETSIGRGTPDVEHEREVAIYDLLEENRFSVEGYQGGPFELHLSIVDNRLVFDVREPDKGPLNAFVLSLKPFRRIVKDYFLICDSYFKAIKTASPSRIEAVDMGRRGLHNEGTQILMERLNGKIAVDFETARRIFTLICVLHWRG